VGIRSASLDVASIRREIDYMVSRARAGEDRLEHATGREQAVFGYPRPVLQAAAAP
jgi:hypothetical protein